ncbi:hypothetical protein NE237_001319 [Protea cynaroides]|uniref:Homeobox domain-containing protein n=1 Tax=Protea cynaroides TaxID=273540 RepID=A0A9Q0QY04_9MAGN|nr:hypothetical protein NE237_001319 [Protea cynaroides]
MASSNRHWPSMFKSKPCNTHHQWQHDINPSLVSSGCQRNLYTSVPGCEDRSPEPKPRWNPKPEQIRILEAIFNSGMVNPPRDEIRKIRAQLQEYGQVGDANVFYWFQNRKSRSKHKQRHLQTTKSLAQPTPTTTTALPPVQTIAAPPSSSSSSSEKSPPRRTMACGGPNIFDASNSPTAITSINQSYFQPNEDLSSEPFFFPVQPPVFSHGFCFSDISNLVQLPDQPGSLLLSELMNQVTPPPKRDEQAKLKLDQQLSYGATNTTVTSITPTSTGSTALNQIHGGMNEGAMVLAATARSTVFINDVAFEVAGGGPINVREAFGDDAVLVHSSAATQVWMVNAEGMELHASCTVKSFLLSFCNRLPVDH